MLQLRIHGRGGQGVVASAELLAVAAFVDGRHAQAFPSSGSERTGAHAQALYHGAEPLGLADLALPAGHVRTLVATGKGGGPLSRAVPLHRPAARAAP